MSAVESKCKQKLGAPVSLQSQLLNSLRSFSGQKRASEASFIKKINYKVNKSSTRRSAYISSVELECKQKLSVPVSLQSQLFNYEVKSLAYRSVYKVS